MEFFKKVPSSFNVAPDAEVSMTEPTDEEVRAAVTLFRQIYTSTEATSAASVLKLLRRSARERDGHLSDAAIKDLRDLGRWTNEILAKGTGMGIVFDHHDRQEAVRPAEILNAYFHGHYLHSGNDLSELAERLDEVGVPRFTFYNVMRDMTRAYSVIANGIDRILAVEDLLDADAPVAT